MKVKLRNQFRREVACPSAARASVAGLVFAMAMAMPSYASTVTNIVTGTSAFTLISDTTGEAGALPAPAPVVTTLGDSWVTISGTQWIGPHPNQSSAFRGSCCGGSDVYTTTFDLTGFNPLSAAITGIFTADDTVVITLNGHTIFNASPADFWTLTVSLPSVPSGDFVAGLNTLSFAVDNSGNGATGLDVKFAVTADPSRSATPETGLIVPLSFALLAGATVWFRRRESFMSS